MRKNERKCDSAASDDSPADYGVAHWLPEGGKAAKCFSIYCKNEFEYKNIVDYITDSDGLTAICPKCGIDSVLPKEYDNYVITKDDIDMLNEMYF